MAQEQIAEYAQQREGEAGHLLGQVEAVARALQEAAEGGTGLAVVGTQIEASIKDVARIFHFKMLCSMRKGFRWRDTAKVWVQCAM